MRTAPPTVVVKVPRATCTMLTARPTPCLLCGQMTEPLVEHHCEKN